MSQVNRPLALVVEDDPQLISIFSTAFEIAGFQALQANDGKLAQEILAIETPSVVLLDLHLPKISGDIILKEIKASEQLQQTKVVLSTADSRLASKLRDEAYFVLLKPVSFKELISLAESLLPSQS